MYKYLKTSLAAAAPSAVMEAVNHSKNSAMEADPILKHGRSSKSHMSRGLLFIVACFALLAASTFSVNAQDIITLRNGDEIKAKVVEVGVTEIRYKNYDNLDGPNRIVAKRDVFVIIYANGTREVISPLNTNSKNTGSTARTTNSRGSSGSSSQSPAGNMAFGAHLAFAMDKAVNSFGIGAKFQYNVTEPLRLEGSFTYFLPKTYEVSTLEMTFSMWDFSVNGHYLLSLSEQVAFYPLAGISIVGTSFETKMGKNLPSMDESETVFGLNIGAGLDLKVNDKTALNAELKYRTGNCSRFMIGAGVVFKF